MDEIGRALVHGALAVMLAWSGAAQAAPSASFAEMSYEGVEEPAPAGSYRNPILPGFHPDPSIVRVEDDFYLVTSTFGWWPGLPVFHSRDLVHWRQIGNAIDRPGQVDLSRSEAVGDGLYAPAITWHEGLFYILNTCVRCGGNFLVTATDPAGPWSDPLWLDFDGIDPSLFVDADGLAWITYNGAPPGEPRYEGHRSIWLQQFDLASGRTTGPRTLLVESGVHPEDEPVWAEGPHLYKVDGWYYLMAAEGGTADQHSQTIYRSRAVTGPYVAGPVNPILTQRDLPAGRPDRVEATGHADLVRLDDGGWWGVFLATRPFAAQDTLLGRETFLLPVIWRDGWPLFLAQGEAVPLTAPLPALPPSPGTDWSRWSDSFDGAALGPQWLRLRGPAPVQQFALADGALTVIGNDQTLATIGTPAFTGRRMRHREASVTTRMRFSPGGTGDFAGLAAIMGEASFLAFGLEQSAQGAQVVARRRAGTAEPADGELLAARPFAGTEVELRLRIDGGSADFAFRTPGERSWQVLAEDVDVTHMASVRSGLFTGTVIGPYAVSERSQ